MLTVTKIFIKYTKYYKKLQKKIEKELKTLSKGSVIKKRIKGKIYYYLVFRSGKKVSFEYLGKKYPRLLVKNIQKRRILSKQLYQAKESLYALNVSKRPGSLNFKLRFQVLERDNFTCQYCGRNVKNHKVVLHVDHIVPKKKGGSDKISNLVTSCVDCNIGKNKYILEKDIQNSK